MEGLYTNKQCPIILLLAMLYSNIYALQGSIAENGSNTQALHAIGITGLGVNVGLISARNVRNTHQTFIDISGSHVFNYDYTGDGVNYSLGPIAGHDTWVAGIIAGRGWTGHTNDIGAAPGCDVYSARVLTDSCSISLDYIEDAFIDLINEHDCRVFVLPLQLSGTADGSSNYSMMVDYFAYTNNVILALASGNEATSITIFGDAHNGITTAALIDEPNGFYLKVGSKSNPGPTVDGRRKPEISSPGSSQITPSIGSDTSFYTTAKDGATSFAIPQTAGVAALLLQYADQTPDADDGRNVVIKAAIVNSAFPNIKNKTGNPTYPANPANVWHSQRGYGRIDAFRAYQILSTPRVSKGSTVITSVKGWAYDSMDSGATHSYLIAGEKNERLILTVTWNRLVNKGKFTYNVDSPLFELDLVVKNSANETIFYKEGDLNNLEKIDLILPADGNYTVSLINTTSKTRAYGLAFEILEPLTGDFNLDYIVNKKDLGRLALDWLSDDGELETNIFADEIINNKDFGIFAEYWMQTDGRYYNP
ncbi:MAG: hypothetical protein A2Y10_08810 [Planctomycetes bacterium GWF2_41_51]|nr:MAG: hypothetical protein A2Y10_08810 [Planctomycetes bacterium GWF2_41_51]